MNIDLIPFLLIVHYIADFICQTRWMGENKSKDWRALLLHVGIYTFVLSVCMNAVVPNFPAEYPHNFVIFNGVAHWLTDYVTSRASRWAYENKRMGMFWNIIGADQLIHGLTLYYSAKMLLM